MKAHKILVRKRTRVITALIVILLLFIGCELLFEQPITFKDVSDPYLATYGQPEEVNEYKSADYQSIDWWWWSQGFMVSFLDTTYDDVNGWTVDHTYSFAPIP